MAELTDAELNALLMGEEYLPQTDTDVVVNNMRVQGSAPSVSNRSQNAETAEQVLEAGEKARREAGGSMGLADEYELEPKPVVRAPASMRVASAITNQDILDLAQSGEFPDDLEHPQEDMEGGIFRPAAVPLKQMYSEIQDPLDRAVFIKDRRDKVVKKRFDEIYRRELKPQLYTALAGGTVAASGISLASMAPAALSAMGGISRNELANLVVDVGVDIAFDGADLYLVYDYITADDDAEKAELEKEFKKLQKEMNGTP